MMKPSPFRVLIFIFMSCALKGKYPPQKVNVNFYHYGEGQQNGASKSAPSPFAARSAYAGLCLIFLLSASQFYSGELSH